MPKSSGSKGYKYQSWLKWARKKQHGTLQDFGRDTGGAIVSWKRFQQYETKDLPNENRGEELHRHFSGVIGKVFMDNCLDDALTEARDERFVRPAPTSSTSCSGWVQLFMDSPEVPGAREDYDELAKEGLDSSSVFVLVARSGLDWIRNRHASALRKRFHSSETESKFVFAAPGDSDRMPNDGSSHLASQLIDNTESGLTSHFRRVEATLQELEVLGATDGVVKVYYHAFVPPYTAAVFDNFILFEPKYLSPKRKPGSQVPFICIQRGDSMGFYEYLWSDIEEVLNAADEEGAAPRWPSSLMRPRRVPPTPEGGGG